MTSDTAPFRDHAGEPDYECDHCGAALFFDEVSSSKSTEYYCCHQGVVPLELMKVSVPRFLKQLLLSQSKEAKEFRKNIRRYNNLFAFTSMKANLDKQLASQRNGIYTFRISGVLTHYLPRNAYANPNKKPKFAQIYFYDKDFQLRERISCFQNLNEDLIKGLQNMIHARNFLFNKFRGLTKHRTTNEQRNHVPT